VSGSAVEVGRLIREARERLGWSQGELAGHLGRSQTAVSYWEAGRRALGVDDLVQVAGVLGVAPADLLPSSNQRRSVHALLRAVAERVDAPKLADQLECFAVEAEKLPPCPVKWTVQASTAHDAAEVLLNLAEVVAPPVPLMRLVAGCGARIMDWDFGECIDGLTVKVNSGAVIWVNPLQSEARRRFTLAHELGHHLLRHADRFHVDLSGDYSPIATGGHPGYDWRAERAANEFAANLLMPAAMVRKEYSKNPDVKSLAKRFSVSVAAMGNRLGNLKIR